MKKIKSVGFNFPSDNSEINLALDGFSSISAADIVVFSPNLKDCNTYELTPYGSDIEKKSQTLDAESSILIEKHRLHWHREIKNFLDHGGVLFVILSEKQEFLIQDKRVSNNRDDKESLKIKTINNYDFLPFHGFIFTTLDGKDVITKDIRYKDFYDSFNAEMAYKVYVSRKYKGEISATFTNKNESHILGAEFLHNSGYLIFLPDISFPPDKYKIYDSKKRRNVWNEAGLRSGKMLTKYLFEIANSFIKNDDKTPSPDWVSNKNYDIKKSESIKNEIQKIEQRIQSLNIKIDELNVDLENEENFKGLLYETGKPLEKVVSEALKILGYQVSHYDDGELELDQVIVSPEGDRYIGECEGKDSKPIEITKFRQLLDGLNADFERAEVDTKGYGLLFGNPQRLLDLSERTDFFTQKCQSGAVRESIGLIKTSDLFFACRYIKENNDLEFAKKCRESIRTQLGSIIRFPEIIRY